MDKHSAVDLSGSSSHRFRSLRLKMMIAFGAVFATIFVVMGVVWTVGLPFTEYDGSLGQYRREILKKLSLVADLKKERFELWLKERRHCVHTIARTRTVTNGVEQVEALLQRLRSEGLSPDRLRNRLIEEPSYRHLSERLQEELLIHVDFEKIRIADAQTGFVLASTDDKDVGTSVAKNKTFTGTLDSDEGSAVEVERESGLAEAYLILSSIVPGRSSIDEGNARPGAVLMAYLDSDDFLRPMLDAGQGLGETGDVVLVNANSEILITLKYPLADGSRPRVLEHKISALPSWLAAGGHEGTIAAEDYRGVPVLAAFRHLTISPSQGWGLVVKGDEAEVFRPIWAGLAHAVILGAVGLLLGLVMVALVADRVSKPLEELAGLAREVQNGNFEVRSDVKSADEVGTLAATFNSMVDRIQNWQEALEQKVEARTEQLRRANEELFSEVKQRVAAERRLKTVNRTLLTLSECNSAMVRATDEMELITQVCRVMAEHGGYRLCWVGYADDDDNKSVVPVAWWGSDSRYVEALNVSWADTERGRGPTGTAIRTGDKSITRDIPTNGDFYPWRADALERGFASVAALPIVVEQKILGAITIYSSEPDAFDDEETKLLVELASDLSYGIAAIRMQERARIAEEAIRHSEEKYRFLVDNAPIGIISVDTQGRILDVNPKLLELMGSPSSEATKSINILTFPLLLESGISEAFEKCYASGETIQIEGPYRSKWGSNPYLRILVTPMRDSTGSIYGCQAVMEDITEAKRHEDDLRYSEERLRLITDCSPVGIRIATDFRYSYVNPAFVRMFGFESEEEVLDLPVESLFVDEDKDRIRERLADRANGRPLSPHYQVTGIRKDGSRFEVEAWGTDIEYRGRLASLAFLVDVSETRLLRAQLLQAQKLESLGTLAGGVAHDFNNLLTVVLGYAELMIQDRHEGELGYSDLQAIMRAARDGSELVKRILTFSRKIETQPRPMNINHQVTHVEKLLRRTIPRMIDLQILLADNLFTVNADRTQIEQMLVNLAVNAQHAMPNGGKLTIETRNVVLEQAYYDALVDIAPGRYVLIEVSDTGHGMEENVMEHIFEPFFTTKAAGEGTGLGLAMVFGIVKMHGGHITCSSEPGSGTTFAIYLPAIEVEPENGETVNRGKAPGGTETILLVDDEELVRALGNRLLSRSGYQVLTAANGIEALEIFNREAEKIQLVILDLIMPEMGGKQCMDEILKAYPRTKILISSGYSPDGPSREAIEGGARGFVAKPFQGYDFLKLVRHILDAG